MANTIALKGACPCWRLDAGNSHKERRTEVQTGRRLGRERACEEKD